jgi:DNA-binding CsgD family transcriptional regulator
MRDPRALVLRGMQAALSGDAPGGIALLRRAIGLASDRDRPYFVDLVLPLIATAGNFDVVESLLGDSTPCGELEPAFDALRSVVLARRGRIAESRATSEMALRTARTAEKPMILARVLQRVALASYYRDDFGEAQERSIEAARAYERLGSYRNAAIAYSVLYCIAQGWLHDHDLAHLYAENTRRSAERAGDVAMRKWGLIYQLGIAAEVGDDVRFRVLRDQLLSNPLQDQYGERFIFVLSESIAHMWSGRFDASRAGLNLLLDTRRASLSERSLCEALLSLCDVAEGNDVRARRLAHLVISRSAYRSAPDWLTERHLRQIARIVASCACVLAGDTTRGRRALTQSFDPDGVFLGLTHTAPLNEAAVPPHMRGYARAINAAQAATRRNTPPCDLTKTQALVLRLLCDGATLDEIAKIQGRSRKTIVNHVDAIYSKLSVHNRTQAVLRARELGFLR